MKTANRSRWVRTQSVRNNCAYFRCEDESIEFCKPRDKDYPIVPILFYRTHLPQKKG